MKFIFSFALLAYALTASATSPIVGPYVEVTIGEPGDATWTRCLILPGGTSKTVFHKNKAQPGTSKHNVIGTGALAANIKAASREKLNKALHFVEQVPHWKVTAGIFPTLKNFLVAYDASAYEYREGTSGAKLIELANRECGHK